MTALALPSGKILLSPSRRILLSDTFSRADSALTLGNAETGQPWSAAAGTWGVSAGQGYSASDGSGSIATIDPGAGNATYEVSVSGDLDNVGSNLRYLTPIFRYTDANNHLRLHFVSGAVSLFKLVGGGFTLLATSALTTADATMYRLRISYVDGIITVSVDGVPRFTSVLTGPELALFPPTLSRVGVHLSKAGTPAVDARFDNLRVTMP